MKIAIVVIVLAIAAGLYIVFGQSASTLNTTGSTLAKALGLSPAQLAALTPAQIAALNAGQSLPAVSSTTQPQPNAQATLSYQSPSPIANDAALATAGLGAVSSIINAFTSNPSNGGSTGGTTTGPTYAQAGISPDLPLTPASPSLLVPLNGDPAVVGTDSLLTSSIDYPGIQSYMTAPDPFAVDTSSLAVPDQLGVDTNAYDGTGGAVYT
jgi:hypothetical protein